MDNPTEVNWFCDEEMAEDRLKEVLNVMLLHITHLNVTAINQEGIRKEVTLQDSKNAMDLAEWFKANYIDSVATTKSKMYLKEKTKKGQYVYTSNLQRFNGKLTTDEDHGSEIHLNIVGRG